MILRFFTFFFIFTSILGGNLSSKSSESSSEEIKTDDEVISLESVQEAIDDSTCFIDLATYELGRSLFSIPFHPFLHHALRLKGVGIATRTQLALFEHSRAQQKLYFPLNRGGGRFVALCLMVLNRAMQGERFLIVASNKILRRYVSSDLQSLGAFCPIDISIYNQTHEKIAQDISQSHITVAPMEGLKESLENEEFSLSEVIVIEPELHTVEEIRSVLSLSKTERLLGLYQKADRLDEKTTSIFPELVRISYSGSQMNKRTHWVSNENAVEKIERILLFVDMPMILVCADEQQAQQTYLELRKSCSLIRHLPATSLRRNKEHAYRLLANKKIQLIVVSQSEFSKKSRHPAIFLDTEPINIEHDCYWLSQEKPQDRDDLEELSLPSLAVLRERFQHHMIHELEKSTLTPPEHDIESLYAAICNRPELLKSVIRDSVQYRSNQMFEQQQEAMRIEEKEAFARKKVWKGGNRRRKKRR